MNRQTLLLLTVLSAGVARAAPIPGTPERPVTDPRGVTAPTSANAGPIPIVDLFDTKSVVSAAFAPDGRTIVYSANLTGRFNLWTLPLAGGAPRRLTTSDDRQMGLAVTPDGRVIYQSDKGGAEIWDLFSVPLAGGEPVNLTNTPEVDETAANVSPDGRRIAFNSRLKIEPMSNIAVIDLAGGPARSLTHEAERDRQWEVAGFSHDGRTLIANRGDFNQTQNQVFALNLADGAAKPLTPAEGFVRASAATADGSMVAVTTEQGGERQAARLAVADRRITPLKPDPWEQDTGDISPDGRWLVFSSNVDGRQTLFGYDLKAGAARALPLPPGVNAEASGSHAGFSPDSTKFLVTHQSGNEPVDLWVVDLKAWSAAPLHALGASPLSPDRLPPTRLVHYRSDDGTVISAFLWLPFNLKRDGHAPGIVYPHGGPTGQTLDRFDRTALALASRGYVVIAPNPRGSTGYGRAFQDANIKDLGGGDLKDEVAAKRFLVATGYVDAKRVGITGGSYGGYMTLMAVAKTPDEWAAGVEQYGIIDWKHMYETEAPTLQAYQRGLMGEPDGDGGIYARQSPMTYIHQTRAPLLVLQGDNDIRVPKSQAEQVVATLKADGRTVDAHFYPGEGHGFAKREDQIDALARLVDWFDRYLKPER